MSAFTPKVLKLLYILGAEEVTGGGYQLSNEEVTINVYSNFIFLHTKKGGFSA